MRKKLFHVAVMLAMVIGCIGNSSAQDQKTNLQKQKPMTLQQIKQAIEGEWTSIAPEIRPSTIKGADGAIKPLYLIRAFTYFPGDKFQLEVTNLADAYGKVPVSKMLLKGHIIWQGDHLIAPGAQKVKFIADEEFAVTPLVQGFADLLNQAASNSFDHWEINKQQSILKKAFKPFGLAEGQFFAEYDLIYVLNNLLFWGARNIDGRGFDTEENRPTNLQIPLIRR